ncbi:MAG: type IV pilin protein, partial [Gemmatimonadota bacterium]
AGERHRPGFTLVEILIVTAIFGLLAAIAIYRTTETTRQAHLAVLKSDLRSMTVAQEIHHQTALAYAALEDLPDLQESAGVTIDLTWLDRNGYAATAAHTRLPNTTCGVFRGPAADGVAAPAEVEGVIACQ